MSVPKRRLGRGLDTLLGQPREAGSSVAALPIDAIRPNPQQPRITFDPAALAELEHSIRELGVLVPIIVRPPASVVLRQRASVRADCRRTTLAGGRRRGAQRDPGAHQNCRRPLEFGARGR
jgi:hypothetical protein